MTISSTNWYCGLQHFMVRHASGGERRYRDIVVKGGQTLAEGWGGSVLPGLFEGRAGLVSGILFIDIWHTERLLYFYSVKFWTLCSWPNIVLQTDWPCIVLKHLHDQSLISAAELDCGQLKQLSSGRSNAIFQKHASHLQLSLQESHFIGFDFLNIQPQNLLPDDVAQRIEWIHGNLFVQVAPHPQQHR